MNCVKADIVCLQETHSSSRDEFISWVQSESDSGNNRQSYAILSSPGSLRSAGVAILYRPSVSVKLVKCDDHGRFITVRAAAVEAESSVI